MGKKDKIAGYLEVGSDSAKGEVVINHPDLKPDKDGVGHIVFSPRQARNLAILLAKHADILDPVGIDVPANAVFRLTVRCTREPNLHAKILRISNHGRDWISELAKILNGTSEFFMRKIGELSPVGKCCTCGAPVECEVVEELPK